MEKKYGNKEHQRKPNWIDNMEKDYKDSKKGL